MEYPTLFTAGTRWFVPWSGTQPESVTVHEAGHQFWYGLVATNEFEHAWMDEGLNTYSTARAMQEAFPNRFTLVERYFGGLGAWAYPDVRWTRDIDGNRLNAYRPVASYDDQSTPTWRYWPGSASAITYNKTALWLATLERMLGWETTQKILATHFRARPVRAPDARRVLCDRQRGQRPGPDVVLRRRAPEFRDVRLRRGQRHLQRARGRTQPHRRRAALRRRRLPHHRARHERRHRAPARLGWPRPLEGVRHPRRLRR